MKRNKTQPPPPTHTTSLTNHECNPTHTHQKLHTAGQVLTHAGPLPYLCRWPPRPLAPSPCLSEHECNPLPLAPTLRPAAAWSATICGTVSRCLGCAGSDQLSRISVLRGVCEGGGAGGAAKIGTENCSEEDSSRMGGASRDVWVRPLAAGRQAEQAAAEAQAGTRGCCCTRWLCCSPWVGCGSCVRRARVRGRPAGVEWHWQAACCTSARRHSHPFQRPHASIWRHTSPPPPPPPPLPSSCPSSSSAPPITSSCPSSSPLSPTPPSSSPFLLPPPSWARTWWGPRAPPPPRSRPTSAACQAP